VIPALLYEEPWFLRPAAGWVGKILSKDDLLAAAFCFDLIRKRTLLNAFCSGRSNRNHTKWWLDFLAFALPKPAPRSCFKSLPAYFHFNATVLISMI
jgi:hypothetical protein